MKMVSAMFGVVALMLGTIVNGFADDERKPAGKAEDAKPLTAQQFIEKTAQEGLAEVELGKLAAEKATNPKVKEFGRMMVNDHAKANKELADVANRKQVKLPTQLDRKNLEMKEKLTKMRGEEFDRAYMDAQVKAHEEAVAMFDAQSKKSDDPDVKAFAGKTLPTLKHHLEMAKDINGKRPERGDR